MSRRSRGAGASPTPLRGEGGLTVPGAKQQRAHSQPNIREGLANLNDQLCSAMLGMVLGGGAGAETSAARASSASPSVVSRVAGVGWGASMACLHD